jgi:hypothetical protein
MRRVNIKMPTVEQKFEVNNTRTLDYMGAKGTETRMTEVHYRFARYAPVTEVNNHLRVGELQIGHLHQRQSVL